MLELSEFRPRNKIGGRVDYLEELERAEQQSKDDDEKSKDKYNGFVSTSNFKKVRV